MGSACALTCQAAGELFQGESNVMNLGNKTRSGVPRPAVDRSCSGLPAQRLGPVRGRGPQITSTHSQLELFNAWTRCWRGGRCSLGREAGPVRVPWPRRLVRSVLQSPVVGARDRASLPWECGEQNGPSEHPIFLPGHPRRRESRSS